MKLTKYICCVSFLVFLLILAGCAYKGSFAQKCTILFEDNSSLYFQRQIYESDRYDDLSVSIGVPKGNRISSVNYNDYSLSAKTSESLSYDYYTLTLHQIKYSAVIRLETAPAYTTTYHYGEKHNCAITITEESPHLYFNTLSYSKEFNCDGMIALGWNTMPDRSGQHIGFGSRIDHRAQQHMDLYLEQIPASPVEDFSYLLSESGITITGYHGTGNLIIPSCIDGFPVTKLAQGAFSDLETALLVLPATLKEISPGTFGSISTEHFYLFDNIEYIPEEAFQTYKITSLHINAVLDPVYSGSYFDSFADKADYLSSIKDDKKIVLFCGSSARFGYDSARIEQAFPGYKVVNMGVYAYSNMLPQAKLLLKFMKSGDVLLSSPELDAIEQQFCGETALDKETFCMMESNYDLFSLLDCRDFTNVFTAFNQYNTERRTMSPRSYLDSPSYYDEDGTRQTVFTYNRWGDYILHRENNIERKNFGIKRAFYNTDYIREIDLTGLNDLYDSFTAQGILVCFTYSPRSNISLSPDSTPESIATLEQMLQNTLHANIISSIDTSLMDPLYFHGTDNHLSTEGVQIHTTQIIEDLRPILEELP